jgi:hypothetical protein
MPPATILSVGILGATIAAIWVLSGVPIEDASRYVAFEALYVLLPGCLLYILLSPAPEDWLSTIAIAWPCGYAIEIGAFALTAAVHARGAFALLPLAAVAVGAPLLMSARGRQRVGALRRSLRGRDYTGQRDRSAAEPLLVAIAISAGLLVMALLFFASSPLPAGAHSIAYNPDNVAEISWAAEARNHWPITMPWVAGQSAHYYFAAYIHVAAVGQVTGVALSTTILRLLPTTMIVVIALQLWSICRSLGRSRWIGPVALVLLLVVQDLNVDPTRPIAFSADIFNSLPLSPSYALGAVFLLGLLALVQRWLTDTNTAGSATRLPWARGSSSGNWRVLILLGVFVLGAGAAKTSAVAVFLGALGLYWLWRLAVGRASLLLSCALVLTAGCFIATYLFTLKGGYVQDLGIHPFDFLRSTVLNPALTTHRTGWLALGGHPLAWYPLLGAAVVGVSLCILAPLLGAAWLVLRPRAVSDFTLFCVAAFSVALVAYLVLGASGNSEAAFFVYGYIALVPIAAEGLVRLWEETPPRLRRMVMLACAAMLALGLALAASTQAIAGTSKTSWYVWYAGAYGMIAVAVAIVAFGLQRGYAPTIHSVAGRMVACSIPLLCTLGLVKPVAGAFPAVWKTILNRPTSLTDTNSQRGMTAPLYQGLIWVRDHTTSCDVIAVNNHYSHVAPGEPFITPDSYYPYYSAFTERRVFLESWYPTPAGQLGSQPYPGRLALNDLATLHGSVMALQRLAKDGVSYVLIDKTHGGGAPESASVSRLVFDNSALSVYRLRMPAGVERIRPGCGAVSGI